MSDELIAMFTRFAPCMAYAARSSDPRGSLVRAGILTATDDGYRITGSRFTLDQGAIEFLTTIARENINLNPGDPEELEILADLFADCEAESLEIQH